MRPEPGGLPGRGKTSLLRQEPSKTSRPFGFLVTDLCNCSVKGIQANVEIDCFDPRAYCIIINPRIHQTRCDMTTRRRGGRWTGSIWKEEEEWERRAEID